MRILKSIAFYIQLLRFTLVYIFIDNKNSLLQKDIARWEQIMGLNKSRYCNFAYLMAQYKEFRNIVIYRSNKKIIGRRIIKLVYPPLNTVIEDVELVAQVSAVICR